MLDTTSTRLVIGPNASMSAVLAWRAFALVACVALLIAGLLTVLGYWPVLPFAGLESLALGAALWFSLRRNRYREILYFEGPLLRVEFGLLGSGVQSTVELRRDWVRVSLEHGPYRNSPTRLWLSCSGQRVELARCVAEDERERLATRIGGLTGAAWRAAAGADQATAADDVHR